MNDLHLIVREQFPEFVRSEYPVFVEFVKAYYKWVDTQSVGKIQDVVDIDNTPEQFVTYFRQQLDQHGLFHHVVPFNRLYIQKIKQIYNTKGSEQALVNLLRIAFQAKTEVRYPADNILRASDGRWNQQSFVVVQQIYGSLPQTFRDFFVKYNLTDVRVELTSYETIGDGVVRLFFRPSASIQFDQNQTVYVYDNGVVVFAGKVIRIPVKIDVVKGGTNWQMGQVIVMPGTVRNTVARVSEVTPTGQILNVQILEYGFDHSENQTIIVSPYPNKPLGASYDIVTTQTSTNPPKYLHTIGIYDYLDGVTDDVTGIVSGVTSNSYFLQDYAESEYSGYTVFTNATSVVGYGDGVVSDITIEQWLASRATLSYTYGTSVTQRGQWTSDSGMLSNENIRLQDNFYYQQFSYDVEADINSAKYIDLAAAIHPAGMKLFTTYALSEVLDIQPTAVTSFPFIKIDLFDNNSPVDANTKLILKSPTDQLVLSDPQKAYVTKALVDDAPITDASYQLTSKRLSESLSTSDTDVEVVSKRREETLSVSDTNTKTTNKYVDDSITVSSPDTSTYVVVQYNTEDYFGEYYVRTDRTLTIGE